MKQLKTLLDKIIHFFDKRYWLFLILIVFISYGQMLGMYVWQDDNALFFKLQHIDEGVGYFGKGPIGIGITKYTATPFIPIYYFFRDNTVPYFALLLVFYAISTIFIYKTFLLILGKAGGRVAGFLFAAGYISSDGFWRMANSVTTSISLITISTFLFAYWRFYKRQGWWWYFIALLSFFLTTEFAINRSHYFFVIVVFFEFIFLTFNRPILSIIFSVIRILPFFYIFNNLALTASESRTPQMKEFLMAVFNWRLDLYYGFLSTVANLVVPDWLTNYILSLQKFTDKSFIQGFPLLSFILLALPVFVLLVLFKNHPKKKILIPGFVGLSIFWLLISKGIFASPLIQPTTEQIFVASLGGLVLLIIVSLFILLKGRRSVLLFLLLWLLVNIAVYSAYNPTFQYTTVERYIAHSFFALVGLLGLLFTTLPKKGVWADLGRVVIILLGVGNIISSVFYQSEILKTRSFPSRDFYSQLKTFLPTLQKGDLLYFDVSRDTQRYYNDAVATAMMPETTAFAWRYGIDRYDIKLVTDFNELIGVVKKDNIPVENIYSFWYSQGRLRETTQEIRSFWKQNQRFKFAVSNFEINSKAELIPWDGGVGTLWRQPDLDIPIDKPISSIVPLEITMEISALPISKEFVYPLIFPYTPIPREYQEFWNNYDLRQLALEYKKEREEIRDKAQFHVSSDWQGNVVKNVHDGDLNSFWQSERTGWGREPAFIEVKLFDVFEIGGLAWINGFAQNTPTKYNIEVSLDGQSWQEVKKIENTQSVNNRDPQLVSFNPVRTRYIRMVLLETLNGDSPVITEVWPISSRFSKINLGLTEKFLREPFWLVPSGDAFSDTFVGLGKMSRAQLVWQSDKRDDWQSLQQTEFEIIYDGSHRTYKVIIPAGGTEIFKLRITNMGMPGNISLRSVKTRPLLPQEVD